MANWFSNTATGRYLKASRDRENNPIVQFWSESASLPVMAAIADSPPLLDVPVSDEDVLVAWDVGWNLIEKDRMNKQYPSFSRQYYKPKLFAPWVWWTLGIIIILSFIIYGTMSKRDWTLGGVVSGIIFWITIANASSLSLFIRLRWGFRINPGLIFALVLFIFLPALGIFCDAIVPIYFLHLKSQIFIFDVHKYPLIVNLQMMIAYYVTLIILTASLTELTYHAVLRLVHQKRGGE
jgi:hypothetical protein